MEYDVVEVKTVSLERSSASPRQTTTGFKMALDSISRASFNEQIAKGPSGPSEPDSPKQNRTQQRK